MISSPVTFSSVRTCPKSRCEELEMADPPSTAAQRTFGYGSSGAQVDSPFAAVAGRDLGQVLKSFYTQSPPSPLEGEGARRAEEGCERSEFRERSNFVDLLIAGFERKPAINVDEFFCKNFLI